MCGCNSNFTGTPEERKQKELEIQKNEYTISQLTQAINSGAKNKEDLIKRKQVLLDKVAEIKKELNADEPKMKLPSKFNWKKYALLGAITLVGIYGVRKFVLKK